MSEQPGRCPVRLAGLPLPAKLMLTLFLMLIGAGYLVALANIYFQHEDADLEPGLTLNDLRRTYHGLDQEVTGSKTIAHKSEMLEEVEPGGGMREYLEKGGPESVRALIAWLEAARPEADFTRTGQPTAGDPSPQKVIAQCCTRCHNATDGEMAEVPYARNAQSPADYKLVAKVALPETEQVDQTETRHLAPESVKELVHITHAHILSIPVFALIVGGLFLLTGLRPRAKLILGPLPLLAVCCDLGGWWLARVSEPFIYVIAAAGAVFGISLAIQLFCIFGSMWFGSKKTET